MKIKTITFIAATLCSGLNVYASEINLDGGELYINYQKRIMDDSSATTDQEKPFSISNICKQIKKNYPLDDIKKINFRNNSISDQGAKIIAQFLLEMPALKVVDLSNNTINGTGLLSFKPLLEREDFRYLVITGNPSANRDDLTRLNAFLDNSTLNVFNKIVWIPENWVEKTELRLSDSVREFHKDYYLGREYE